MRIVYTDPYDPNIVAELVYEPAAYDKLHAYFLAVEIGLMPEDKDYEIVYQHPDGERRCVVNVDKKMAQYFLDEIRKQHRGLGRMK